jgi:hypothetical protein
MNVKTKDNATDLVTDNPYEAPASGKPTQSNEPTPSEQPAPSESPTPDTANDQEFVVSGDDGKPIQLGENGDDVSVK